jgi:hypothetical protein
MWFPQKDAKDFLNRSLTLPASGFEQDWEIELADATRVSEFVIFLKKSRLKHIYEEALVSLILASFEDAIWQESFDDEVWNDFLLYILSDRNRFNDVIFPWLADGNTDFAISDRLRQYFS